MELGVWVIESVSSLADTGRGAKRETEVSRIVIRNRDAMCRE